MALCQELYIILARIFIAARRRWHTGIVEMRKFTMNYLSQYHYSHCHIAIQSCFLSRLPASLRGEVADIPIICVKTAAIGLSGNLISLAVAVLFRIG